MRPRGTLNSDRAGGRHHHPRSDRAAEGVGAPGREAAGAGSCAAAGQEAGPCGTSPEKGVGLPARRRCLGPGAPAAGGPGTIRGAAAPSSGRPERAPGRLLPLALREADSSERSAEPEGPGPTDPVSFAASPGPRIDPGRHGACGSGRRAGFGDALGAAS